jgi:hypothetical protein
MKHGLLLVPLVLLFPDFLYSQTTSALTQVMATTSLIVRPDVFRVLQANTDIELTKVKPGLQIEGMHEAIGGIRDRLLDILTIKKPQYNGKSKPITLILECATARKADYWTITIQINSDADLKMTVKEIKQKIRENIQNKLDDVINSIGKPKLTAAFVSATSSLLLQINTDKNITLSDADNKEGTEKLAYILTEIVFGIIQQKIETIRGTSEVNCSVDDIGNLMTDELTILLSRIRTMLVTAFNRAEYELSCAIDETSQKLVAANTGIGITKGKGSFNGGLYVSIAAKTFFQFGVYVNGELSKSDSSQPTESLIGTHLRFATDNWQFDLLGAGLFGDTHFKAFTVAELGLGISTRTKNDLLLGAALYALGETLPNTQFTVGLTVQSATVGAPSVFIGIQGNSGDIHPVIQTSFPVVP